MLSGKKATAGLEMLCSNFKWRALQIEVARYKDKDGDGDGDGDGDEDEDGMRMRMRKGEGLWLDVLAQRTPVPVWLAILGVRAVDARADRGKGAWRIC